VQSRLSRARERLRGRLTRRGLAIPAGLVALVLAEQAAWAEVPALLVEVTLRSAARFSAGQAGAAGATSTRVDELAQEVLREQSLAKLATVAKIAAGFLVVASVATLSLFLVLWVLRSKIDQHRLQGIWLVEELWEGPIQRPPQRIAGWRVIFNGDQFTVRGPGFVSPSTYRLDPTKEPKEFDLVLADGKTIPGIYRLEGDRLQMVMNFNGPDRPIHFNKQASTFWTFYVTHR
jgi:uncharacterized protein (TIGR03067 family)